MKDIDRYRDPEERRAYLREYMRAWRKRNPAKQKAIQDRQNARYRLWKLDQRCYGDGFEFDDTNLLPETPRQSRMWAELLARATA